MSEPAETLVLRGLRSLARAIVARPRWFVWPQVALVAACAAYTVTHLEFVMDRNSLLDSTLDYNRNFLAYRAEFPAEADLVAVVESEDPEKNRQFVERLAARLAAVSTAVSPTNLLSDVFYKGDLKVLGPKALHFVPATNLTQLRNTLGDYRPFLEQFSGASNLNALFAGVNTAIRTAGQKSEREAEGLIQALPALERILRRATESLSRPGNPPSPGVDALFDAGSAAEDRKYITLGGGRIYLVTARPRPVTREEYASPPRRFWQRLTGTGEPEAGMLPRWRKAAQQSLNAKAMEQFRDRVAATEAEVTGVNVGVTGEQVLDFDEMVQSQRDTTLASVVALSLVAVIFVFGYQEASRPLKATACLVAGIAYTMAFATATVGHLNILTITFVPMLIGLAIDFGVHLITRFEEELRRGRAGPEALTLAMMFTGKGIFTGCLTTAGAFLAMSLTEFRGIREMGIICGGGLVICLVPMMTLLPALLLRPDRPGPARVPGTSGAGATPLRERIERLWLDRPWTILGLAAAATVLAAAGLPRVRFDYNLLKMQSPSIRSVAFEHKLLASAEKSVIFGAVVATNIQEARALETRLMELPSVASVESMARFLGDDPEIKQPLIRDIGTTTAPIRFAEPDRRPVDLEDLGQTLWSLGGYLSLAAEEATARGRTNLVPPIESLREAVGNLRAVLFRGAPAEVERRTRKLGSFQVALLEDLRETIGALQNQDADGSPTASDLPDPLRNRFIGIHGSLLLQVYPRGNVWEREPQEAFIRDLQTVVPGVTGAPVQMYYYTELLRNAYLEAAGWALAATVLLVGLHFRNLLSIALALLPVVLGSLWVVGLMGWTGLAFNPANIMMLPLVIGIGITNGIHILNRFTEERNPSIFARSTGKAVFISALTTIAGFGSLLLAEHQGIRSLGFVMVMGTAACMIAGLTVLPSLLSLTSRPLTSPPTRANSSTPDPADPANTPLPAR
ncbi:MAG: MMPL family transporter [Verrucomicrobiae bacterium]|nr:MMPL family transporter [Verrucomicrobiae bacterium]